MPELVQGEPAKRGLDEKQALGENDGEETAQEPKRHEERQVGETGESVVGHGEQGTIAEHSRVDPSGHRGGDGSGDEGTRGELEQEELGSEYDGGNRRAEGRCHASRGATRQKDLALRR